MSERIIILALILIGTFFLIKKVFNSSPQKKNNGIFDFVGVNSGLPTILYFWTEQCTQCFNLQKPALSKLEQEYQNFNLISFNAVKEYGIVKKLNIKTVPATVVLSKINEIKFVNNGFATEKLLASQLEMIV